MPLSSMCFRQPVIRSEWRSWKALLVVKIAEGILAPVITNRFWLLNLIAGNDDCVSIKDCLCPDKFLIRAGDPESGQFRWRGKSFSGGGWRRSSKFQSASDVFESDSDFISLHFC